MDRENRSYAEIVKDNVRREWDETRPRDARDWIHLATDGWLEPFDKAPLWLLAGLAAFGIALYLIT